MAASAGFVSLVFQHMVCSIGYHVTATSTDWLLQGACPKLWCFPIFLSNHLSAWILAFRPRLDRDYASLLPEFRRRPHGPDLRFRLSRPTTLRQQLYRHLCDHDAQSINQVLPNFSFTRPMFGNR